MNRRTLRTVAIASAGGLLLAGCSSQGAPENDIQRDLARARTSAVDLLPRSGGQQILSDVESAPTGARATRPAPAPAGASARPTAPVRRTPRQPAPEPAPIERESAAPADVPAAPRPSPSTKPATQPPPPGGFKTMEEMIRKAPFPINP